MKEQLTSRNNKITRCALIVSSNRYLSLLRTHIPWYNLQVNNFITDKYRFTEVESEIPLLPRWR